MAYADTGDVVSGTTITEAWGDQVRANFQAGVPDIFTTKGDIAAATAADTAARLAVGANDSTLVAASGESTGLAWQIQPTVRAYNSGSIDPTANSWVTLTFDADDWDTDAMHDTGSSTSRLTVPTGGDGIYTIIAEATLNYSGETSGELPCGLRFRLNGASTIAQDFRTLATHSTGHDMSIQCVTLYDLAATDYVEVQVFTLADVDVTASSFMANWERRP